MTTTRQDGDTVFVRRTRQTGTEVACEYAPTADAEQPWLLTCVEHGGVCSFQTLAEARRFAASPLDWCEDCMYGDGTLAGSINPASP